MVKDTVRNQSLFIPNRRSVLSISSVSCFLVESVLALGISMNSNLLTVVARAFENHDFY
jgi:hypothetical protein